MYALGEQRQSFLLFIEKRDYKQHILFCSLFKQQSCTKVGGDMPDYDSGLSQAAKLVKGVLNKHFLLCVLKPSLTFLLSFGLKSPCRTSVCRLKRTIYTLELLSQSFCFVLHT